jgi:hypothetical protein
MLSPAVLVAILGVLWLAAASAMGTEPEGPSTVLFDTKVPLPPPAEVALGSKSGWVTVPEDDLTHRFQGDAVAMNDRLTLVLGREGCSAIVYARTAAGAKEHVLLSPVAAAGHEPDRLASLRILENSPGAVMLAATFAKSGRTCSATYRLAAGQMIVEVRPGQGTGRLLVREDAGYAAVPDFFGNDMAFDMLRLGQRRLLLPAENFFLTLSERGNCHIMCVWPSRKQQAAVAAYVCQAVQAARAYFEIDAVRDKSIWVAVLDGDKLWHEQAVSAEDARQDLTLAWKPPFSAKWRADLVAEDGPALSWYFRKPLEAGDSPPVCCLEGDRAVVRLERDPRAAPSAWHYPAQLIVYPIDRERATPLTTFTPMDVLRNTLGVGPCQYILQTEGLGAEVTPDSVMTWVEKQFRAKKEKKAATEIREQLDAMVAHVRLAQARVAEYGRLAGEIRDLCKSKADDPAAAPLDQIAAGLQQTAAAQEKPPPADRAAALAAQVAALVGKPDALAECQKLGAAIRAVGAGQDAAMSNCRMAVRWLRASAAMIAEEKPKQAELAKTIEARAEKFLAGPEKPDHKPE